MREFLELVAFFVGLVAELGVCVVLVDFDVTNSFMGSSSSRKVISSSYCPKTISEFGSHLQPSILSTADGENRPRTEEPYLCFMSGTRLLMVIRASSASSGRN